jgi:hypothetical protein
MVSQHAIRVVHQKRITQGGAGYTTGPCQHTESELLVRLLLPPPLLKAPEHFVSKDNKAGV